MTPICPKYLSTPATREPSDMYGEQNINLPVRLYQFGELTRTTHQQYARQQILLLAKLLNCNLKHNSVHNLVCFVKILVLKQLTPKNMPRHKQEPIGYTNHD